MNYPLTKINKKELDELIECGDILTLNKVSLIRESNIGRRYIDYYGNIEILHKGHSIYIKSDHFRIHRHIRGKGEHVIYICKTNLQCEYSSLGLWNNANIYYIPGLTEEKVINILREIFS